jgi:hypothetical protein
MGTIKDPGERKQELMARISDILRDNQDLEYVQGIANEIIKAQEEDKDTIEFYKSIINKIKPDADNN